MPDPALTTQSHAGRRHGCLRGQLLVVRDALKGIGWSGLSGIQAREAARATSKDEPHG